MSETVWVKSTIRQVIELGKRKKVNGPSYIIVGPGRSSIKRIRNSTTLIGGNPRKKKLEAKQRITRRRCHLKMRGRSYSPSPPPRYSRRGGGGGGRSPSPRRRYAPRQSDLPTSLLVRNLRHDCRPEDLRRPFGHFGPLKDIYLPKDYYTGLVLINLQFHSIMFSSAPNFH